MPPNTALANRFFAEVAAGRDPAVQARRVWQQQNAQAQALAGLQAQMRQSGQAQPQDTLGSLPRSFDPFERPTVVEVDNLRDEFVDEVEAQNRALLSGPDGTVMGDMAAQVMRRNELQSLDEGRVRRVFINPASAYKGVLGGSAKMVNGAPTQRVVNWFADRFDEAIPLSIFVGPTDTDTFGNFTTGGAQNRAFANIYWLNGRGVPMSARVDAGKGRQIGLHGSFVAVDLGLDAGNAAGFMNLGAWLSFWPVARTAPTTTTMFVDALGAAGVQTLVIPSCATGLLPVQATTVSAAPNIEMQMRDKNANVIGRLDLQTYGQMIATQPLPDDAYDILVTNNDAAAVTARFIFQLSL